MKNYSICITLTLVIISLSSYSIGGCNLENKKKENKKPLNILYIMADDHAYQAVSAYGSQVSKLAPTPNIDRIANEGARMDAVYCTNSICGPSRASILTGKLSHVNGFYKNVDGGDFNGDQLTFPKVFKKWIRNCSYWKMAFGYNTNRL